MSNDFFVSALIESIVHENLSIYQKMFKEISADKATDNNWKFLLSVFEELDTENRELLLGFIKQIMIDTTSSFLGILDGNVWLREQEDDFELKHGKKILNGDLQSRFLEKIEEDN